MTRDEIKNWYLRAQSDFWYQKQLSINIDTITKISTLDKRVITLFITGKKIQSTGEMGDRGYKKLEEAIGLIERREVVWYGKMIEYLKPPSRLPRKAKITNAEGFSLFDTCASCGGNKWLMGEVDGKPRMVCYTCLPPPQWAASGMGWTGVNIIKTFLEGKSGTYGFI